VSVVFLDASDRSGVWRLLPGDYRVSAPYDVPADLVAPQVFGRHEPVWQGQVRSPQAVMTVLDSALNSRVGARVDTGNGSAGAQRRRPLVTAVPDAG
jgi:hypothetical protein